MIRYDILLSVLLRQKAIKFFFYFIGFGIGYDWFSRFGRSCFCFIGADAIRVQMCLIAMMIMIRAKTADVIIIMVTAIFIGAAAMGKGKGAEWQGTKIIYVSSEQPP